MNYRLMQRLLGSTALYDPREPAGDQEDGEVDEGDGAEDDESDQDDEFEDPDDDQDDEPDEGEDPPPEQRRQARSETRVQRLANEKRAADEKAARLERELAEERRLRSQGPQRSPEELQAERDRRLAGMTAEARLEYLIEENRQLTDQRLNAVQFQTWDANDKSSFAAKAARNPTLAAMEDEVEQTLQEYRKQGQNVPRETIAAYLIGQKALNRAPRARNAGKRREQEGREQQGARPVNGRGDRPPTDNRRLSEQEARRKRLEGVQI